MARDRVRIPGEAEIACSSWKGVSRDGSNESQLSSDVHQHYASRIEQAVNAVAITGGTWAVAIIGALIGLAIASNGGGAIVVGLLIMIGAGAFFFFKHQNLERVRQQTREALEKERDSVFGILKAALAELTDFRREVAQEDLKADRVTELLHALSSPEYILKRPEQSRAVIA